MKRIVLAIAAILGLSACETGLFGEVGNGISMTQEIEVGDFDRISIPSFVDVYYTQSSDQQCVTLTCDENLFEYYHIEAKDGELIVYCKGSFYNKIDTYLGLSTFLMKAHEDQTMIVFIKALV